ncbi:MAG: T9SS type A sorting domain-containing protein [Flavobacteriales bacterium]
MYRSVLSAGLMAIALLVGAQSTVHQVVVLNEGYYDYFNGQGQLVPVTLGSYDPSTGVYQTVATITGPRFGSDVLVDGSDIYVAADDRVVRFDADTYQQTGEVFIQGVRKLAIWNDQLLITRGELGGLPHYFEVRDRNSLDLIYAITPADGLEHAAEDVLVVGDKAYLAVGNAFEWGNFVGRVGVVDLQAGTYGNEVDLGPDGTNPEKLMLHEGDIITFNNTDFSHSSISRVNVAAGTIAYTTNVSANSSCAASAKVGANGRVYYMEYAQNELARFDLSSGAVADTLAGSPAVYGLIEDPVNGVLYATTTDFFSTGDLHVMDLEGNVLSTVAVGVSPGNLALDIRLSTSVNMVERPVLGLFPNPANETVALSGVPQGAQVHVFDSMGRTVLERSSVNVEGVVRLDITTLRNGVYTVEVQGMGTLRFTKG